VDQYLDKTAFRVVQGNVEETVQLLKLPFDHFFYTGNGRVGREVMKAAAEHLSTCTLELGGKSPVYVHEDADLEVAAKRIVSAKFLNAGQVCVAPDYLLVHEKVADKLTHLMKDAVVAFYGPNKDTMARIVNVCHFDRVKQLIEDHHGGKVIEGDMSKVNRGAKYIPPVFVVNPSLSSKLMVEEIFGPVLPILPVSGVDKALQVISDMGRDHPLAAYVFTSDTAVAEKYLEKVQSGGACQNDLISHLANPNLPFGGSGKSGIGGYHGKHSFDSMSLKQSVLKRYEEDENRVYPPYNPKFVTGLKSML